VIEEEKRRRGEEEKKRRGGREEKQRGVRTFFVRRKGGKEVRRKGGKEDLKTFYPIPYPRVFLMAPDGSIKIDSIGPIKPSLKTSPRRPDFPDCTVNRLVISQAKEKKRKSCH
jgi:hypothetical protein